MEGINKTIKLLFFTISFLFIIQRLFAQIQFLDSKNNFLFDYYTFKSDEPDLVYLDFYVSFNNSQIQFVKSDNQFHSEISLTCQIKDKKNEIIEEQQKEEKIFIKDFRETLSSQIVHMIKFPFSVSPGEYTVNFKLADKFTKKEFIQGFNISIPNYSDKNISISSIQFLQQNNLNTNTSNPNLSHIFTYLNPEFVVYYETYNLSKNNTDEVLQTNYTIINEHNKTIYNSTQEFTVSKPSLGFKNTFSINSIPPGRYIFRIKQQEKNSKRKSVNESCFYVVHSPINLRFKSFAKALEELQFIANTEEIENLKDLPELQHQQGLNVFWKSKDPSPETESNELMTQYYNRIRIANNTFTCRGVEGYKSDFGIIFLLFGEPDEVKKYINNNSFTARQVWNYKRLGLSFVFVAQTSISDYYLMDRNSIYSQYIPK